MTERRHYCRRWRRCCRWAPSASRPSPSPWTLNQRRAPTSLKLSSACYNILVMSICFCTVFLKKIFNILSVPHVSSLCFFFVSCTQWQVIIGCDGVHYVAGHFGASMLGPVGRPWALRVPWRVQRELRRGSSSRRVSGREWCP
jgi:hypothetical protein